jgi:hypothetical protein
VVTDDLLDDLRLELLGLGLGFVDVPAARLERVEELVEVLE